MSKANRAPRKNLNDYPCEMINFSAQKVWDEIGKILSERYSNDEYAVKITYKVRPKEAQKGTQEVM